jgi:hypothetical protein
MIRFALKCDRGHGFESWFQSGTGFERQRAGGLVDCPVCGSTSVEKSLMAPHVAAARPEPDAPAAEETEDASPAPPGAPAERLLWASSDRRLADALRQLRRAVETHTEDVGKRFATEVRAIEAGEAPRRGLRGLATREEAQTLQDEGISVVPLPFRDPREMN